MDKTQVFQVDAYRLESRIGNLTAEQSHALERAMALYDGGRFPRAGDPGIAQRLALLLPLAEFGLGAELIVKLMLAVPEGWPWDHREIYYDFRLGKWMRHIEPPTISQCLDEYFEHSESPESALAYLRDQWERFLRRHAA
jgi:hypothetical protein